jgi:ribosome biogenesis GTPase
VSESHARVLAQYRGLWLVDGPRLVHARGRLGVTPVTGDYVVLDEEGAICAVAPRGGTVTRRAAGRATGGQVLAANVDLALIVEPLPQPNLRRIERLSGLAKAGGVPAVTVLTKADLAASPAGLAVAATTGEGVETVRALLAPGTTTVLLGPSGAGKSTLVNALLGEERQATGAIRADGRGRHTTVTRELLALAGGAFLIDTPGIREAGVWDGASFDDVDALAAGCRFGDCAHEAEPGCAVRPAVDPERLAAWRKLRDEQAWVSRRRAGREHAAGRRR